MKNRPAVTILEAAFGVGFEPELLRRALTHRSFAYENGGLLALAEQQELTQPGRAEATGHLRQCPHVHHTGAQLRELALR